MNCLGILWIRNKRVPYIKDGVRHYYIPDYFIPEKDSYVEVKGYFDDAGKQKMRLVLEQNPGIRIYFICDEYK